jgi:RecA/RadA recombinase
MIKQNLIQQKTPAAETLSLQRIVHPHIMIQTGIQKLDELLGGFKAGEITFVDGNSSLIAELPHRLCANTYRAFHSDTVHIDGGMSANPYHLAQYARMMELDDQTVLDHIHISRAFTVYQLTTVIQDLLEPCIQRYTPLTLILGQLPTLHLDSEISPQEAQTLMKQNIQKLRQLTATYNLITIVTHRDKTQLSATRNLRTILSANATEIVHIKQSEQCIRIELLKQNKTATIACCAHGQLRLDDFGMVI